MNSLREINSTHLIADTEADAIAGASTGAQCEWTVRLMRVLTIVEGWVLSGGRGSVQVYFAYTTGHLGGM